MNSLDEATLLKMAEDEILGEAKRAALRHSIAGVSGWQPCPKPNKFFLTNTLLQTVASNRLLHSKKQESQKQFPSSKAKKKSKERKLLQRNKKSTNFIFKKPEKIEIKICLDSAKRKGLKLAANPKEDSGKTSGEVKNEFKPKPVTPTKR